MDYKIHIGDEMPRFKAQDFLGQTYYSDDLKGVPLVLYFYPKDDTPGCTKEACSFRDNFTKIKETGATLLGISPDDAHSHQKFSDKYLLNFTLLTDSDLQLCKLFDVLREKNVDGKKKISLERSTFIIDHSGRIFWIERPVSIEGHTDRVIQALKNLR